MRQQRKPLNPVEKKSKKAGRSGVGKLLMIHKQPEPEDGYIHQGVMRKPDGALREAAFHLLRHIPILQARMIQESGGLMR